MCKQCLEAVREFFPDIGDELAGELLISATAFPFGGPEIIRSQLKELRENSDGTLEGAMTYASKELDEYMARIA